MLIDDPILESTSHCFLRGLADPSRSKHIGLPYHYALEPSGHISLQLSHTPRGKRSGYNFGELVEDKCTQTFCHQLYKPYRGRYAHQPVAFVAFGRCQVAFDLQSMTDELYYSSLAYRRAQAIKSDILPLEAPSVTPSTREDSSPLTFHSRDA